VKSPSQDAIVDPSLRPPEPGKISAVRRCIGFASLAVGFVLVLIGCFVPFGLWLWLFIPGGILMSTSPCLLGTHSSRASGEQEDGHKLYGHE